MEQTRERARARAGLFRSLPPFYEHLPKDDSSLKSKTHLIILPTAYF